MLITVFKNTVEFTYDDFGYNGSLLIMPFFVSPSRIRIFYMHSSSAIASRHLDSNALSFPA